MGLLNGMYGGLGQSVGAIIGGSLSRKMGIVKMFFIAGAADFIAIILFIVYQVRKNHVENRSTSSVVALRQKDDSKAK